MQVGESLYTYSTGDSQVSVGYIDPMAMATTAPPKFGFDRDLEKLTALAVATPPSAGVLVTALKALPTESRWSVLAKEHGSAVIVVTAATLGGVAIGYYVGHRSGPDYDNPVFQHTLRDPQLWSQIEQEWRRVFHTAVAKGPFFLVVDDPYLEKVFEIHPEIAEEARSNRWKMPTGLLQPMPWAPASSYHPNKP